MHARKCYDILSSYHLNRWKELEEFVQELDQGHKSYIPCSFDTIYVLLWW